MKKIMVILVLMGMLLSANNAHAIIIINADQAAAQTAGQDGLGDFVSTLIWDSTFSKLYITLDNTTNPVVGGYITRFDFNNPEVEGVEIIETLTLFDTNLGYATLNYDIMDSPFGYFDFSVNLRDEPTYDGIGINDAATFEFNVTLKKPEKTLTELDFTNAFSTDGNYSAFYLARFQSMDESLGEGSDKVPGKVGDNPVPEPMTMLLFGPALLGLVGLKRRKA